MTPLFTLTCLALVFLVWQKSPYVEYLNSTGVLFAGLACTAIGLIIAAFFRTHFPLCHDLFCVGSFCVWFVHWREIYRVDAPVFAWYPIFFIMLVLILNRQVIDKWRHMDRVQLEMIRRIYAFRPFHPAILTIGVLLSIYYSGYYIFYPIVLSFFLIHCSFGIVLREIGAD